MSIETSLSIIAISVGLLVVFILVALVYLIKCLRSIQDSAINTEQKISPILAEAHKIAKAASSTTFRIKDSVEEFVHPKHEIRPQRFSSNGESQKEHVNVGAWAEWIAAGVVLLQRLKNKS